MKTNNLPLILTLALFPQLIFAAPYISGEVGYAGYGENNLYRNLFDNYSISQQAAGRLSAGYLWDINSCTKYGLELGFSLINNTRDYAVDYYGSTNLTFKRFGIDLLGVLDYTFGGRFNVFAKAGAAYVQQKLSVDFANYNYAYDVSLSETLGTIVPKGTIGVGYNITDNVNINLSLNHEFSRTNRFGLQETLGLTSMLVGLKYRFC